MGLKDATTPRLTSSGVGAMLRSPILARAETMVFFNYSTMQMAAKVVYYGPGLCGKTTNLHYIYGHTSGESRGEMVSLETETDRTLFFDLLPIDVGQIAGFNTRIQLYTVPGQVFYNTTRKLVLKGVDGVVFVADSQRAMVQANVESFRNLEENLVEMGLSSDTLPLVLQYNKRDLADICTLDEMNAALNRNDWPWFEASAVTGVGVFETLKGISRQTLMALKKRLGRSEPATVSAGTAGTARPAPAPATTPRPAAPAPARCPAAAAAPTNGRGELSRTVELTLRRSDFQRARRFIVSFQVEDEQHRVMDAVRDLQVEIKDAPSLEKLLLRLNIALHAKE